MLAGRQLSALGRLSGAVMQGLGGAPLQHARGSASAAVKVLAAGADPAVRALAFLFSPSAPHDPAMLHSMPSSLRVHG